MEETYVWVVYGPDMPVAVFASHEEAEAFIEEEKKDIGQDPMLTIGQFAVDFEISAQ